MRQRSGKQVELIETGCLVQKGIRKRESWRSSVYDGQVMVSAIVWKTAERVSEEQ